MSDTEKIEAIKAYMVDCKKHIDYCRTQQALENESTYTYAYHKGMADRGFAIVMRLENILE